MKELCKAQKEFGRESEYFRGILQATLSEAAVTPADLRRVFSCFLNPTEQVLWEGAWRKEILRILPSLWDSPNSGLDADGGVLSVDHLLGTGNWADGPSQARAIPLEALQQTAKAAEKAFLGLRAAAPQVPYSRVLQGAEEPFLEFVERLRKSINYQVEGESVRAELLKEVAFLNANPACRDAINSLPLEPPPALRAMLEVCGKKVLVPSSAGTPQVINSRPKQPFRPSVAAVEETPSPDCCPASRPSPQPALPTSTQPAAPCHLCGKIGHWMPQCPLRKEFHEFKRGQREASGKPVQKN
ncbi:endogenous retrovirus group K member 5 Gag polyprotein-like [Agelaius tricolor]|uniref:endogenous retrovirus group K member 5 Gag polyprotein-like n=1 Tax=Agelaius tricolor TaxID=9191 RepID=UPI0039F20B2A